MKRILVFGMTENPGGVESFLMNYYRHIDRSRIQFDFLANSHESVAYEQEIISMGARVFHITARSENLKVYKKELKRLFVEHSAEWQAIWVNVCSLANIDYLKIAKQFGIKKRIIHSHNSQNMDSKLRGILHNINKRKIKNYATDYWACSEDAAKWFYSDLEDVELIHNAIDVEKLAFDSEKRTKIRNRMNFNDDFIIGNIGRLHFQKNQMFILDIYAEVCKKISNSKLVLIGQGEDEDKLKEKCRLLGIQKNVIFTGVQDNINQWLSAFDLFLFPSLFEGLSIAALEAQASGIPVLASIKVIPEEVKFNDNFVFYDLNNSALEWADELLKIKKTMPRKSKDDILQNFIKNGYEIGTEAQKLEKLLVE